MPLPEQPPEAAPAAVPCPADPGVPLPPLPRATVEFRDATSSPSIEVEVARSQAARTKGLMYRTAMAENEGMLFSWDSEARRSFWMRNTCLPLDMIFVDSHGTIVSILEQVPTLNLRPRPSVCPAAHVIEVNAGWVRRNGVQPGQSVRLPSED